MESKYKERAVDIVNSYPHLGPFLSSAQGFEILINLMCQLAEEVEDSYIQLAESMFYTKEQVEELINKPTAAIHVIKHYLTKLLSKKEYKDNTHLKFMLRECDIENDNTFTLFNRGQVEELLQKQRELCANNAIIDEVESDIGSYCEINKNSILNVKLKID